MDILLGLDGYVSLPVTGSVGWSVEIVELVLTTALQSIRRCLLRALKLWTKNTIFNVISVSRV